ncbi:MAG: aldo/keto reductase [Bernardetiaceae bacterium]|jgi:aryl-alcohol dehydrogenase-like predicted oxidoreductase|nr:aldo/keto reductase [Bernardetiaceae bacterium]
MKYNLLGRTGLLVSEICLGAMTFGGKGLWSVIGQQPQDEVNELVKLAFDAGVNFFDTANAYSEGLSEQLLGQALRDLGLPRQQTVVATKLRLRMGPGPNQVGLSRGHIYDAVDDSLHRLGLAHIDLLYVHGVDALTPLDETMRGLEDVVRAGKVRYLGICNMPAWQVMKANALAERQGWTRFAAMQYYYTIADRTVEHELVPLAQDQGMGLMPWSPLAGGFLSGKFTRQQPSTGTGARRDTFDFPPVDKERAYDIIEAMQPIAAALGVSVAQVALAWLLGQPAVTSIIVGAKRPDQLRDNLAAASLGLTEADRAQLGTVSSPPKPYPHWMVDWQAADRKVS